jgi:isopentenyl diphosphate isomerase/L-lactate dehydrogenase-like FMN-dependent dehydrogenase
MTEAHIATTTSVMPGIYANGVLVTVQTDGMVRIVFQDIVGGEAVERAHMVMTTDGAHTLVNLLQTMIQPSGPASAAN